MPIQTRIVPSEVCLCYRGVAIRRLYQDNDFDSPDPHRFVIVSDKSPAAEHFLDVRDLPGYSGQQPTGCWLTSSVNSSG